MFRLIWAASIHTHAALRWAPTNLLLTRIRTRRGLKWGMSAMLIAAPCLLAAATCTQLIKDGGPGWFNLLVALFIWDAFKFLLNGPISGIALLRARLLDRRATRRMTRATGADHESSMELEMSNVGGRCKHRPKRDAPR